MKRRSKVIVGLGLLFVALLVSLFIERKQFVGFAGSPTVEGSRAVTDGGIKTSGWSGRVDPGEAKAGMNLRDARFVSQADDIHVTTGPAVSYWRTDAMASGNFTVTATFAEPKYMNLNSHPHPYGLFIGGNDMGTSDQTELYCVASGNGKFMVRGFGPEPFKMSGVLNGSNTAIHKAAGRGRPVSQEISLSVRGDKVVCSINGSEVASYNKTVLTGSGKLKSTDGYYGVRFAHNTDVIVSGLSMSTQ